MSGGTSQSPVRAQGRGWWIGIACAVLAVSWIAALIGSASAAATATLSTSTCQLGGPYKHVIYIQYDNTHLSRDNPNVPSDLEQVPALKNFLSGNGTLLDNHHTPLI